MNNPSYLSVVVENFSHTILPLKHLNRLNSKNLSSFFGMKFERIDRERGEKESVDNLARVFGIAMMARGKIVLKIFLQAITA